MTIFFIIIVGMILFGALYYPAEFGGYILRLSSIIESSLYGFTPQQRRIKHFNYYYLSNARYKKRSQGKDKITKPTLILLHGFSADHSVWLRCANQLGKHYHVILLDLPGHGQTGYQVDADYSIPAQSQRLYEFISALDLQEVHLAGNSMGGFLAAQFALDFPHHTASIICVDPAGVTPPRPSTLQSIAMQGRNPFFMDSPDQFADFFKLTMAKPPFFPKSVKLFKANEYVKRKPELIHIYQDFFNLDHVLDDKLANIECPILMLWGGLDDIIHISCAQVWQDKAKTVTVIWDDLGHMPMLEAPQQTADEIIRFIGKY